MTGDERIEAGGDRRRERAPWLDAGRPSRLPNSAMTVRLRWRVQGRSRDRGHRDLDHVEAAVVAKVSPSPRRVAVDWRTSRSRRRRRRVDDRVGLGQSPLVERIVEQPVHLVEGVVAVCRGGSIQHLGTEDRRPGVDGPASPVRAGQRAPEPIDLDAVEVEDGRRVPADDVGLRRAADGLRHEHRGRARRRRVPRAMRRRTADRRRPRRRPPPPRTSSRRHRAGRARARTILAR